MVTPDGHDPKNHTDSIPVEKTVDDNVLSERFARNPENWKQGHLKLRGFLQTFSSETEHCKVIRREDEE